jgi:two-component system sensor histidine kinase NblS
VIAGDKKVANFPKLSPFDFGFLVAGQRYIYYRIKEKVEALIWNIYAEKLQTDKNLLLETYPILFRLFPSRFIRTLSTGIGVLKQEKFLEDERSVTGINFTHVAHELKLPLFNIQSFLETLYEYNLKLSEKQRLDFLESANKESNRLVKLIDNILSLQSLKLISSTESSRFEIIHLSEVILQVISSYSLVAKNKKIQFYFDLGKSSMQVFGNSDLIGQVINNLMGNSLKYTFDNKKIHVRTRDLVSLSCKSEKKSTKIQIGLLDQGIGISRDELDNIFVSYTKRNIYRLTSKIKGNGLGLIIVTQILHSHHSELYLISYVKRGSWIGFTLPIK